MIILIALSFIFDGICSMLTSKNTLFFALFSLMSLIVVYPHVINKQRIILYGSVLGLFYDLIYTQTPFLNTILFSLLSFFILLYYRFIPYNIVNSIISSCLFIFLYRLFTYIIFLFVNDLTFNWHFMFKSFYSSLILNIAYIVIMNILLRRYYNKKKHSVGYKL